MLINSPDCSTCLFSWYGLLIMVGGVGCVFSQTRLMCYILNSGMTVQEKIRKQKEAVCVVKLTNKN